MFPLTAGTAEFPRLTPHTRSNGRFEELACDHVKNMAAMRPPARVMALGKAPLQLGGHGAVALLSRSAGDRNALADWSDFGSKPLVRLILGGQFPVMFENDRGRVASFPSDLGRHSSVTNLSPLVAHVRPDPVRPCPLAGIWMNSNGISPVLEKFLLSGASPLNPFVIFVMRHW